MPSTRRSLLPSAVSVLSAPGCGAPVIRMIQVSQKYTLKFRLDVLPASRGRDAVRSWGSLEVPPLALRSPPPSPAGVPASTWCSRGHKTEGDSAGWRGQRRAKGRNARQDGQYKMGGGKAEPPRGQGSPHTGKTRGPLTFSEGHRVGDPARAAGPRHLDRQTSKWQPRGSGRPAGDGTGEGGERDIFGHSLARHGAEEALPRSRKRGSRVTRAL